MKSKLCSEFIRVLHEYRRHVRETFEIELREVRADNDPCFTDNSGGPARNVEELQAYIDSLKANELVVFTHSPPEYQALNPVECAVRQLYHLMNFFLECGHLSPLCWMDMALAAVYVMNRLPHPQSKVRRRRAASPYELVYRRNPDLSDLIAGPGELVVVDWIGAKASAGEQTGEHCYYIMPTGAGHLVRSFRTLKTKVTKSVRTLTAPGQTVQSLVSLRHTLQVRCRRGCTETDRGLPGHPPRPWRRPRCHSWQMKLVVEGLATPTAT